MSKLYDDELEILDIIEDFEHSLTIIKDSDYLENIPKEIFDENRGDSYGDDVNLFNLKMNSFEWKLYFINLEVLNGEDFYYSIESSKDPSYEFYNMTRRESMIKSICNSLEDYIRSFTAMFGILNKGSVNCEVIENFIEQLREVNEKSYNN